MTTLNTFLKSLQSYDKAYMDYNKSCIRIKCFRPLTESDFTKLCEKVKNCKDVLKINNEYKWKKSYSDRYKYIISKTFVIYLTKSPSKIILSN